MARKSCFKKFLENCQDITCFDLSLHIKLQLSVKLSCVGPVLSRHWMFLVPYCFYVSYKESHTEDGNKVKRKAETRWLFKTPALESLLMWHTLEGQANLQGIIEFNFLRIPCKLIVYIGGLIQGS